jgi:hypothetical protein
LNDNMLKKVQDEATIYNLLSGIKENSSDTYVWRLVGNSKHLAQVRIEAIRKSRKDFCIIPVEGQEQLVHELIGHHSQIDMYVPDSALLLRCVIRTADAPLRYYLQIPDVVAQVERRKNIRLNVHASSEVKISFAKTVLTPRQMTQHFAKDCFDFSTGGFSFLVSKMEFKFFQIGDKISSVDLKAGNHTTKSAAEVVMIREIEPDEFNGFSYKVWRISCRFSELDMISKKYFEKFIFERIKDELRAIND